MLGGEEDRVLKAWLRGLVPDGMSQSALARELGVERRTVVNLLSESAGFGYGITMLRFLQLAGAVVDAPTESPLESRLAAIEARVEQTRLLVAEGFGLQDRARELEAELQQLPEDPPATGQATEGRPR